MFVEQPLASPGSASYPVRANLREKDSKVKGKNHTQIGVELKNVWNCRSEIQKEQISLGIMNRGRGAEYRFRGSIFESEEKNILAVLTVLTNNSKTPIWYL